jgi:hypothetical protein
MEVVVFAIMPRNFSEKYLSIILPQLDSAVNAPKEVPLLAFDPLMELASPNVKFLVSNCSNI